MTAGHAPQPEGCVDADEGAVCGGDEDLALEVAQEGEEAGVALRVELAGDVVEGQDGGKAELLFEEADLGDFEGEDGGPLLALRGVGAGVAAGE